MFYDRNHKWPHLSRKIDPPLPPSRVQEIFCEIMDNVAVAFNGKWSEFPNFNGVNSSLIKSCLNRLQAYPFELRMLWRTVYLLFLYFEERRDPKLSPLVAKVLYFIAYESFYIRYMLSASDIANGLSILERSVEVECFNNIVLRLMRRPYTIPTYNTRPEMRIVWSSVMMESEKFLPLLLRQGVVYIPPSTEVKGWQYCTDVLNNICFLQRIPLDFAPEQLSDVLDPGIPGVRQRTFTVFRAMDVVQHTFLSFRIKRRNLEGGVIQNYHERFRMLFDTIPEPIVTLQEVRHILMAVFDEDRAGALNMFCDRFKMVMPESDTFITPRSLKHLSRYRVREVMRVNGVYPYGVYDLPLPKKVRNYVLLKDPDND